jgi:hypothetical protein
MKTAKEIKEELEKEHGWNFSSEENMEMYYELFLDVQKVALRQQPVVGRSEQLPKILSKKAYKCANTMTYEGFLDWWELYS